jgi:hypothetical protein
MRQRTAAMRIDRCATSRARRLIWCNNRRRSRDAARQLAFPREWKAFPYSSVQTNTVKVGAESAAKPAAKRTPGRFVQTNTVKLGCEANILKLGCEANIVKASRAGCRGPRTVGRARVTLCLRPAFVATNPVA